MIAELMSTASSSAASPAVSGRPGSPGPACRASERLLGAGWRRAARRTGGRVVDDGDRGQRAHQVPDRAYLPVHRETPAEQPGRVGQLGQRRAVQDGHHQGGAAPPGPPDERGHGRGGPADLAAEIAAEGAEHGVLGVQGDHAVVVMAGAVRPERETERPQRLVVHERRDGQRLPGEQRLVVGGDVLAPGVEPVRCHGHRVVGLQVVRLGVHHRHAPGVGPGRLDEGYRRVVGGDHQQRFEQVGDPVSVPGDQPDLARLDVGGPARGDHGRIRAERLHQGDGGQHLQRAGGPVQAVRVLGGQHLAGARVGDDIGGGCHLGQPPAAVGGIVDDHSAAGQLRAADRRHLRAGRAAGSGAPVPGLGACGPRVA